MQGTSNQLARKLWPELNNCPLPMLYFTRKSSRRIGTYNWRDNRISLSTKYYLREGFAETLSVVIHELCHWAARWLARINGKQQETHHGPTWREQMRRVGLDPRHD